MAKEIKEIPKGKNPVEEKKTGTTHINIETEPNAQKIQYQKLQEGLNKLSLHNKKVCSVMLSFTIKGEPTVCYFGATPEVKHRAQFLAEKIAEMVPVLMQAYEMPNMDVSVKKPEG